MVEKVRAIIKNIYSGKGGELLNIWAITKIDDSAQY